MSAASLLARCTRETCSATTFWRQNPTVCGVCAVRTAPEENGGAGGSVGHAGAAKARAGGEGTPEAGGERGSGGRAASSEIGSGAEFPPKSFKHASP
eukprot:scaffold7366_cov254-Pinguiococcus_pyrenoidosus.AAC.18